MVLYGHTPVPETEWINDAMCLDEREVVSVPAQRVWYEPSRPLLPSGELPPPAESVSRREPGVLNLDDVAGRRSVETRHHGRISIQPERAAAALEVMSRFAIDPRWLVYLPPTMAPVATSNRPDALEHPEEAFAAYQTLGVQDVLCEEKHMGSRAVVLVCRDDSAGRFGIEGSGAVHTRTGRPFFAPEQEAELLAGVRAAVDSTGLWDELNTDWLLLDAELMPWSAKAGALITDRYASVGAAAEAALPPALESLAAAAERGVDVGDLLAKTRARADNASSYRDAYRRYCWPTEGLRGVRLAPFQLLATEGRTYHDREHDWHLALADRLVQVDSELFATTRRLAVDTTDPTSTAAGITWWEELAGAGGEGMVVKPAANLTRGKRGLVQPGLKVRGREYLRIIYGPDYTEPANLDRLRQRGLGRKRGLAAREYALGLEALERLARGEPLWRVHECVFAVLALESEPVDPRL